MGAKIASFLATLILSIPLAAIGLMAVFGIPQLVPANGDQKNVKNSVIRNVQDALNWGDRSDVKAVETHQHFDDAPQFHSDSRMEHGRAHDHEHDHAPVQLASHNSPRSVFDVPQRNENRFRDEGMARDSSQNSRMPPHWSDIPSMSGDRSTQSSAFDDQQSMSNAAMETPAVQPARFSEGSSLTETSGPLLTWRQASVRLNDLGVKDYHLERGTAAGTFLFVCVFSPGDAPHVVHRFESEADDPLVAVNQVLQQVDKWMRSRYASANFPSKPQSLSPTSGSQLR